MSKSFLLLFFKKEVCCFFCHSPDRSFLEVTAIVPAAIGRGRRGAKRGGKERGPANENFWKFRKMFYFK